VDRKLQKDKEDSESNNWMRKTDSDWKTHNRLRSEYSREALPKNNSDNKLGLIAQKAEQNITRHFEEQLPQPTLYERTLERMNHKALYTRAAEGKKQRDVITPPNPGVHTSQQSGNQRNSTKKPTTSYLLNDSYERNTKNYSNETTYNNYLSTDKRMGNLIRKPKNDPVESNQAVNSSKLRNTVLKKIQAEEAELSFEGSRRYQDGRYNSAANQRDYSLELYKKQMSKDKSQDYELIKEVPRDPKRDSRPGSRSVSKSVNRQIDISNDRINVGKLLDYYRDQYD
jgi:hypothetical protein